MFITFEGIEGAGKSSQALSLADRLSADGLQPKLTHEPGGTPYAGAIRALLLYPEKSTEALAQADLTSAAEEPETILPLTEVFMLSAARIQHVERIRQWLEDGYTVISDRYADATYAYQGRGRDIDIEVIKTIETIATSGLKPDLTILLDLSVDVGQRRKNKIKRAISSETMKQLDLFEKAPSEWNRLDAETAAFHGRVRAGYLELARAEPERWVVLDADQPVVKLAEQVWQAVRERLNLVAKAD